MDDLDASVVSCHVGHVIPHLIQLLHAFAIALHSDIDTTSPRLLMMKDE